MVEFLRVYITKLVIQCQATVSFFGQLARSVIDTARKLSCEGLHLLKFIPTPYPRRAGRENRGSIPNTGAFVLCPSGLSWGEVRAVRRRDMADRYMRCAPKGTIAG